MPIRLARFELDRTISAAMILLAIPALSVAVAVTIIVVAMIWGWRNGTLHPSQQEHVDLEFERIVRRAGTSLRWSTPET